MSSFLEGFLPEEEFAKESGVNRRTIKRRRDEPDGLPYLEWGGRIFIPVAEAREWLLNRIVRPNKRRRKGGDHARAA